MGKLNDQREEKYFKREGVVNIWTLMRIYRFLITEYYCEAWSEWEIPLPIFSI